MARWDSLMRCRIFNVLNAESADDRAPVRLGIRVVLLQNFLVRRNRLVELSLPPEVIRAVVAIQLVLVLRLRNVDVLPQYSHVPYVAPGMKSMSPPHILHLIIMVRPPPDSIA